MQARFKILAAAAALSLCGTAQAEGKAHAEIAVQIGDLPALFVDTAGNASYPVLAPRLKLSDVRGRSLMVHAGGDNHADHPAPLGGGGARIVCGVIQ